jgi:hypothetical protein
MGERPARGTIGLTAEEMMVYLEEVLVAEAEEAAQQRGTTVEEELASPGFASARAASTYAIKLIEANNAFVARYLLDHGVLQPPAAGNDPPAATGEPDGSVG